MTLGVIYNKALNLLEQHKKDITVVQQNYPLSLDDTIYHSFCNIQEFFPKIKDLLDEFFKAGTQDGLTGLKTKQFYETILKQKYESIRNLGYLMCDVDHFKIYNDLFGHQQGDIALQSIARAISRVADSNEVMRFGGEEFAVFVIAYTLNRKKLVDIGKAICREVRNTIIPWIDKETIIKKISTELKKEEISASDYQELLAEFCSRSKYSRIEHARKLKASRLMHHRRIGELLLLTHTRTISIGGALRKENESLMLLIERADQALYEAKKTRNSVVISE